MNKIFLLLSCLLGLNCLAQKACDYATNVNDSLGFYRSTKEYIIHERTFGNTQATIFFSLVNADGLPSLKVQLIQKSNEFIATKCFDRNSRIVLQLANGKIVTLLAVDNPTCAEAMQGANPGENNRLLSGYFLFMKDSFDTLKSSPISILRIKYTTETIDYVLKNELLSEIDKNTYHPDAYFVNYLKCID